MKVDVTFVKFPASDEIRTLVAQRIEARIAKYAHGISAARAVFTNDGFKHHIRLTIVGDMKMTVTAAASDISRSLDQAIDKLCTSMRKQASRRKLRRSTPSTHIQPESRSDLEKHPRHQLNYPVNAFDKFETEFVNEFENGFENAG